MEVPADASPQGARAEGHQSRTLDGRDGTPGAADLIRKALTTSDDHEALATMANSGGGIYRLGPAMSSVILAACRPDRFTVADSRALSTLRALGRTRPAHLDSGSTTGRHISTPARSWPCRAGSASGRLTERCGPAHPIRGSRMQIDLIGFDSAVHAPDQDQRAIR
jgi:hypothetical protein